MKSTKINPLDALTWLYETEKEYAGHFGYGIHKSLRFCLKGEWRVYNHRRMIYSGQDLQEACKIYDSIKQSTTNTNQ